MAERAAPRPLGYAARLALLVFYFVSLQIGYWYFLKPGAAGEYQEVNWITSPSEPNGFLYANIIGLLLAALVATTRDKPSDWYLTILLMTPVMPMLVMYSDRQVYTEYIVFCAAMYVMIFFITRGLQAPATARPLKADAGVISPGALIITSLVMTALFILIDIAAGNLANINFDFNRVYEFRRIAQSTRGAFMGYYETVLTGIMLPMGTVFALHRRHYLAVAAFLAASFLIYGMTSNRGYFFIVITALVFYFAARQKHPFAWVVGGAGITSLLAAATYQYNPDLRIVGDFTIGRVMFVPTYMNFFHYEFFSTHPFTYWSDSRLSLGLVHNPYGLTGARVVFDHFYGVDLSNDFFYGNANTGFLGAGYGHAGFLGIALYSVVVALLIRAVDGLARRTGRAVAFGVMSYLYVTVLFTSTDVPTVFITYGFLFMLLLIPLLKPQMRPRQVAAARPATRPPARPSPAMIVPQ